MITARNYASQAEAGLRKYVEKLKGHPNTEEDARKIEWIANCIHHSQHFVVQDGGVMFGDGLKGIRNVSVRLPYKSITVEYWREPSAKDLNERTGYAPKIVVLAQEHSPEQVYEKTGADYRHTNEPVMVITYAAYSSVMKKWSPSVGLMVVPSNWEFTNTADPEDIRVAGMAFIMLHEGCHRLFGNISREEICEYIGNDIVSEVMVVLELCEALTCSNVKISEYAPASHNNIKRIRQGKLPIYETKCLTIDASRPSVVLAGSSHATERNSPRQHLRRGHIRRLPDKNVWVNSCVVGDPSLGKITKSYEVKA